MPLNVYRRKSGWYHIRGSHHGRRVDQSARTRIRAEAQRVKEAIERRIFDEQVLQKPPTRTFAEAAVGYMQSGGERRYLAPILERIGKLELAKIGQAVIDETAATLYPGVKSSTLNRHVYTPISAVLNWAVDEGWMAARRIRRPTQPQGRVDWRTPDEIADLIDACPEDLAAIVTFYVGTLARASEGLDLDWRDVSPMGERVILWETKGGYSRHVDLQPRVRAVLPIRSEGRVWTRWNAYDAINTALRRVCRRSGLPAISCHVLRHTGATWLYALSHDLDLLMKVGGWRSVAMAMRYVHAGSPDLADAVKVHGWEVPGSTNRATLKIVGGTDA